MSTTIRVSESTKERIATLAKASGMSMTTVVDAAVDALERRQFFAHFNERYAELRDDAVGWRAIEAERTLESRALRDGR